MTTKRAAHTRGNVGKRTAGSTLEIQQRQARAVELRIQGLTLEEVAAQCGYRSSASAYKAILSAMARREAPLVEALRAEQDEQILLGLRTVFEVLNATSDGELKLKATDRLVRLLERRAKLHGLDAPTRAELTGDGSVQVVFAAALQPAPTVVDADDTQAVPP